MRWYCQLCGSSRQCGALGPDTSRTSFQAYTVAMGLLLSEQVQYGTALMVLTILPCRNPELENEVIMCEMFSNLEKRDWNEVRGPPCSAYLWSYTKWMPLLMQNRPNQFNLGFLRECISLTLQSSRCQKPCEQLHLFSIGRWKVALPVGRFAGMCSSACRTRSKRGGGTSKARQVLMCVTSVKCRNPELENEIIMCEMFSNIETRDWNEVRGPQCSAYLWSYTKWMPLLMQNRPNQSR